MPPTPVAATMPADRLNHSSSGTRLGRAGVGYSRTDAEGGRADDAGDRDTGISRLMFIGRLLRNRIQMRRSTAITPYLLGRISATALRFRCRQCSHAFQASAPNGTRRPGWAQTHPPLAGRRQPEGLPSGSLCRDELGHRGPVRRMDDPVGDLAVLRTE